MALQTHSSWEYVMSQSERHKLCETFVKKMNNNEKVSIIGDWNYMKYREIFAGLYLQGVEEFHNLHRGFAHKMIMGATHGCIALDFAAHFGVIHSDKYLENFEMQGFTREEIVQLLPLDNADVEQVEEWKSITFEDLEDFHSPWAESFEDEKLVEETLRECSRLVEGDVCLTAVYQILMILHSPSVDQRNKKVKNIKQLKSELMLIFRNP